MQAAAAARGEYLKRPTTVSIMNARLRERMNVQYIIIRPIWNMRKKGRKSNVSMGAGGGGGGQNEDLFGADETKEQIGCLI